MTTSTPTRSLRARVRLLCFALASLPLAYLLYLGWSRQLGVNPLETLTHYSGRWSLRFLLLCLAMTPLQRLWHWRWPIHIRRQLGLVCYFWLVFHFALFVSFDLSFNLALLAEEVLERPYITVGFSAWLLLTPLALTSTQGWQRRLKRRWKSLHRLVYPAAILACVHFLWKTKVTELEPTAYALILFFLLGIRMLRT